MQRTTILAIGALALVGSSTAAASELSYTYVDFRVLTAKVEGLGVQAPIPNQSVEARTDKGDGISVAGSVALPARFYLVGAFTSSIIDVENRIVSPLTEVIIDDEFDLVTASFGVGYQRELAPTLDLTFELAYEAGELDFGSLAGESFDTDTSGAGARLGFRWNPRERFEISAAAGTSPYAKLDLDARRFDSGAVFNAGMRWYFFPDLGVGLDYQSGDVSTVTLSMRFSFGNLPW